MKKVLWKKMFLDIKKWVQSIQIAGCNGARTVIWKVSEFKNSVQKLPRVRYQLNKEQFIKTYLILTALYLRPTYYTYAKGQIKSEWIHEIINSSK